MCFRAVFLCVPSDICLFVFPLSPLLTHKNSPVATFASCRPYAALSDFCRPRPSAAVIIREPKFYLREYEPRRNSASPCRGHGAGRGRWGASVSEGLHTPRSASRLSNNREMEFRPAKKIAQKFAYVQFLLYICTRY